MIRHSQDKDLRESGLPGGGSGRRDEVGRSGVYPASGPLPEGNAEYRGQASWGQAERGAEGYEDHGSSALTFRGGQVLGAWTAENRAEQGLTVEIPADVNLKADLHIPQNLRGIVLFAHGSGSSRRSPRNQAVARVLQRAGMATLLLDLLTESEEFLDESTGHLRFDIDLLAKRLLYAVSWITRQPEISHVRLGCFGASTGAAAALVAAAETSEISAVVSRGGRPDLAGETLDKLRIPVLLIVGGRDRTVIDLNRQAMARLCGETRLEIVPGATHLFEEPGALEQVAQLAQRWFEQHLGPRHREAQAA